MFVLGGTIAMTRDQDGGARPSKDAGELLDGLEADLDGISLHGHDVASVPSTFHTEDDLLDLIDRIHRAARAGADGIVVVQGTDTLEETCFLAALLHRRSCPVVFTAAMRLADASGADGPANLRSSIIAAASLPPESPSVLVCMNGELHAAQWVSKRHAFSPSAFQSPMTGPVGWVIEDRPRLLASPGAGDRLDVASLAPSAVPVFLYRYAFGDDGRVLESLPRLGYGGVVIEACGVGHLSEEVANRAVTLSGYIPVVLATRTGAGEILCDTYGFTGSERDLLQRGLISAGTLDGLKVRLLLALCLRAGWSRSDVQQTIWSWSARAAER